MSVGALTSSLQTMPIAVKSGTTALATTAGKNLPMVQNSGALAVVDDVAQVAKKSGSKGKIIAAIRAEKMINGDKNINVRPEIIEMTGGEKIVYFSLNGNKCSAKVPLNYPIKDNIELKISEKDMHFFNKESGELICYDKKI